MLQELLRLSQDGRRVYMSIVPKSDSSSPEVDKSHILNWLSSHKVDNYFRFEDTIESVLTTLNTPSENWQGEPEDVVVAEKRDATVDARLAEDKMSANLIVNGACGGNQVKGPDLLAALKAANIVRGIKKQTLQKLLIASGRLKPGEYLDVPVAFGKEPIPGEDSRIAFLVEDASSRILKPRDKGDGTVDMRDLGEMITVKQGQPLAKLIPATKGYEGFTVTGEVLATEPGKDKPLKVYDGSEVSRKDPNVVIASIAGMPLLHDDGVEVDNALSLKSVTVATGHVNFEGSVVINGDVNAGMKVTATGSVTVGGVVESATIVAGGDIVVQNGVIGRQVQSDSDINCSLSSQGSIVAKFAQYATLKAKDNIHLNLHAMHCMTEAGKQLTVFDPTKRNGTLSGGRHDVGESITVVVLGATAGAQTYVRAFNQLGVLQQELVEINKTLEDEQEQLMKVKDAEMKLLQQPAAKRPPELIERLVSTKSHLFERLSELKAAIEAQEAEIAANYRTNKVSALKSCFSGVHCQIGDDTLLVNSEHGPSVLISDGRKVQLAPLG